MNDKFFQAEASSELFPCVFKDVESGVYLAESKVPTSQSIGHVQLVVDNCFASRSLRGIRGYRHPLKGSVLPRDSLTRDFNQTASNITEAKPSEDDADLIAWFHADDEIDASEEVIGLGDYGKTLTIITADLPDDNDDDESTFAPPRFR
jgi:hypothetical protein